MQGVKSPLLPSFSSSSSSSSPSPSLLSRRAVLAGFALLPLGACGFRPVYGRRDDAGGLAEELRAIRLPDAGSVVGYELRRALLAELNPAGTPTLERYRLAYTISRSTEALAVQVDAVVTRRDRTIGAVYALHDLEEGRVVYRGQARRTASFNIRGEPFADRIAEDDADRRAARELAVAMRQQLVAFFERRTDA
ncbi:MAG: hypothetical protein EA356_14020 [Geminicoccaceae bacterium]|nr:MAG: hypothetical protein EA356_14020 [Geminicoccaceae bacterium]